MKILVKWFTLNGYIKASNKYRKKKQRSVDEYI